MGGNQIKLSQMSTLKQFGKTFRSSKKSLLLIVLSSHRVILNLDSSGDSNSLLEWEKVLWEEFFWKMSFQMKAFKPCIWPRFNGQMAGPETKTEKPISFVVTAPKVQLICLVILERARFNPAEVESKKLTKANGGNTMFRL